VHVKPFAFMFLISNDSSMSVYVMMFIFSHLNDMIVNFSSNGYKSLHGALEISSPIIKSYKLLQGLSTYLLYNINRWGPLLEKT
jgi:hypothetical protein